MCQELHFDYQEAIVNVDRHPCNDMRQLERWDDLTTWLKDAERRRKRPPAQDQPCQSPTRMIQKMWRGGAHRPAFITHVSNLVLFVESA